MPCCVRRVFPLLAASLIIFSPAGAFASSLGESTAVGTSLVLQDDAELSQSFVSGPWLITIVDAIQSPAVEGIVDETAAGNEWVIVVTDIANLSDEPSTITLADMTLVPLAASASESQQAVVISDVNFRAGPGTDTAIVRVLLEGESVTVTGPAENGFLPVETGGEQGWVFADFLSVGGAMPTVPSTFAADLQASQAAAALLRLNGNAEMLVQPSDVERMAWAFPVASGTRGLAITLDGEALPLAPKQRAILDPGTLPAVTDVPAMVQVAVIDVTGSRTIEVDESGRSTEIQLFGIDTPNPGDCFAREAETRLQELVGSSVSIEAIGDEHLVWVDADPAEAPTLVNHAVVAEGFAAVDDGHANSRFGVWLAEADRQAREAELGLWAECTGVHGSPKPQPTPTPTPTQTPAEIRAAYPVLSDVRELAIRPGNLLGDKVAFTGEILTIRVAAPGRVFVFGDATEVEALVQMQVTVYAPDGSSEVVFVGYDGDTSGMFEGTVVTVYGTVVGTQSFTNAMGGGVTQPLVKADIIDFA